ncbi:MAG: enoyl-CoA hydratase-related protein [Bacteroidota bacterium]
MSFAGCCNRPAKIRNWRGIIITGDGEKAFVAGADIKELSALSGAEATKLAQKGQDLFKSIENSPKPVIGRREWIRARWRM